MKVKIKGLVFVGFAAAILSANAMATDANTVTSKSYVDAKIIQTTNGNNTNKAPSENAVKTALGLKQDNLGGENLGGKVVTSTENAGTVAYTTIAESVSDITGLTVNSDASDKAALTTAQAVQGAIEALNTSAGNTYQPKSQGIQVGYTGGVWKTLSNGNNTTVATATDSQTGEISVKIDVAEMGAPDGTTGGTVGLVPASGANDAAKVLTAGKTWVAKQNEQSTANKFQVSKDAAWSDITNAVSGSTYVTTSADNNGGVQVALDNVTSSYNGTNWNQTGYSDNLTTEAAVDGAISAAISDAMGGQTIPQKSSVCSTNPCALVAQSDGLHWYTMATSTHDGGVPGDYCTTETATTVCGQGYTCTSGACTATN